MLDEVAFLPPSRAPQATRHKRTAHLPSDAGLDFRKAQKKGKAKASSTFLKAVSKTKTMRHGATCPRGLQGFRGSDRPGPDTKEPCRKQLLNKQVEGSTPFPPDRSESLTSSTGYLAAAPSKSSPDSLGPTLHHNKPLENAGVTCKTSGD